MLFPSSIRCAFGFHRFAYAYSSDERMVAVDTVNNQWVDQSRPVKHFTCERCGARGPNQ